MKEEIRQKFCELIGKERVLFEEPMSRHTTFRIGGPAEVFLIPESYGQIQKDSLFYSGERKQSFGKRFWIPRRDYPDGPQYGRNPAGRQ